ncbi:LppC family lipoprotein, partial [Aeromonas salmonicida]|uniref:penicillin-binding protein activator n=1 Tax=Aeromonas salmonicida TaxID=645 RepID=UPI001874BC77
PLDGTAEPQHNTFNGIDAAYIVGNPTETRTIKPYIDFNVSQANGGLATFTAARGYDSQSREVLPELNGLHISDMPIMLGYHDELKAQVQQLWPQLQGDALRLFAMGYDAFSLTGKLQQLRAMPTMSMPGLTGELSVPSDGVIHRQPVWATYRNGTLRDENAPTPQVTDEATPQADAAAPAEPAANDVSDASGQPL